MNVKFVRELLARAAAASWADANRNETEARQQGHLHEIVAWRTPLQKIDRRIARYGLDRHARP